MFQVCVRFSVVLKKVNKEHLLSVFHYAVLTNCCRVTLQVKYYILTKSGFLHFDFFFFFFNLSAVKTQQVFATFIILLSGYSKSPSIPSI